MNKIFVFWVVASFLHGAEAPAELRDAGAEEKRNYVRVLEEKESLLLQTSIVTMRKDGVELELIGAIHLADEAYYKKLNQRFMKYDRLLFEMVGGEMIQKMREDTKQVAGDRDEVKAELSALKNLYERGAKLLNLQLQNEGIDYLAKNFVHADLTMKEFAEKQAERKESLLGFVIKSSFASMFKPSAKEPNSFVLLAALFQADGVALKRELIHTMGEADDQIQDLTGKSVIVNDRNDKCLEVLEEELAAGHGKIGIFYGSAHFPAMEEELMKKGWQRVGEEWVTAWDVPQRKSARKVKTIAPGKENPPATEIRSRKE